MRGAAAFVDRGKRMTHKCYNLCFTVEMLTHDGPAVIDAKARYWWKMAIFAQLLGPHRSIVITFGIKKTRMVWLHDGEKL